MAVVPVGLNRGEHQVKFRTSLLAAASALALLVGLAAPAGAATPPTDVTHSTITCNSVVGTLKFNPPLTLAGDPDTTPPGSVAVKATLGGCSTNASGVTVLSGAGATGKTSPITSAHSSCNGLSGLSDSTSGDLVTKWKTATGTPKITPTASTLHIAQTFGGVFNDGGDTTPAADSDSWGGQYGIFMVGTNAAHGGTAQPTVSGAFQGNNSGHTSTIDATTGQSFDQIALQCLLGIPVKALNFGIGGATLQ
jgi:hypothetical protein